MNSAVLRVEVNAMRPASRFRLHIATAMIAVWTLGSQSASAKSTVTSDGKVVRMDCHERTDKESFLVGLSGHNSGFDQKVNGRIMRCNWVTVDPSAFNGDRATLYVFV